MSRKSGVKTAHPRPRTVEPLVAPLFEILKLNTRLVDNSLVGVHDFIARRRLNDRTNSLVFILLHLVDARYYLGRYLGLEIQNPFRALLDGIETIEQMTDFPPLDEVLAVWRDVAGLLIDHLETLEPAVLEQTSEVDFPIDDHSVSAGAAFLLQHESYHIGQLAFLRKYFGLGAMKYA